MLRPHRFASKDSEVLMHPTWGPTFPAEPRQWQGPMAVETGEARMGLRVAGCNPAVKAAGAARGPENQALPAVNSKGDARS